MQTNTKKNNKNRVSSYFYIIPPSKNEKILLSFAPNPIYFDNSINSKILFKVTPFSPNGIYLRTFHEFPVTLKSPLLQNDEVIIKDSLTYHYNVNKLKIFVKVDQAQLEFSFEVSKSLLLGKKKRIFSRVQEDDDTKADETSIELNENTSVPECAICIESIPKEAIAYLNPCKHYFCYQCIKKWSKCSSECPYCMRDFTAITREVFNDKTKKSVVKEEKIRKKRFKYKYDREDEMNDFIVHNSSDYCMKCNQCKDPGLLLICDKCKYNVCHTYCDNLEIIPSGSWYCPKCREKK